MSDQPYAVSVGVSTEVRSPFPANFVAETEAPELRVAGPDVTNPAANKAFYRVVAVDGHGNRSGPSDYAAAPRPLLYSRPPTAAKLGKEFRYSPATIRSLGDLRMRVLKGKETLGYWDVEKPRFILARGPRWLTIDEATGALTGTPDAAGRADVEISVTLERERRQLDPDALQWGVEKIVSSGVEKVGTASQNFVLDTTP